MPKLALLFVLSFLASCSHRAGLQQSNDLRGAQEKAALQSKRYDLSIAYGKQSIPIVMEFHRLFGDAVSSISYYTGEYGDPEWNSKVGLYGRYILTMQFKIELDDTRTKIIRFAEPRFHLVEVESISPQANGTHAITYGRQQVRFGIAEWQKLLEGNGDFSVIGVTLEKDKPVDEFSKILPTG
ncbi:MAG TPA: hypothetical protein VMZ30_08985 [Pyrinomonadaceae bacterium]|nr:hypothetical protein [Pyrinomonadaceae bacterium]